MTSLSSCHWQTCRTNVFTLTSARIKLAIPVVSNAGEMAVNYFGSIKKLNFAWPKCPIRTQATYFQVYRSHTVRYTQQVRLLLKTDQNIHGFKGIQTRNPNTAAAGLRLGLHGHWDRSNKVIRYIIKLVLSICTFF